MNKLLIICGPTATGKTSLGISLAKKFSGEIISADSRQVYRGMDIGTGKDLPKFTINEKKAGYYLFDGVPVWMLDVVEPGVRFSVADYYEMAWKVIKNIWERGKFPIIVGGTGLYIKAVTQGLGTMGIGPDWEFRNQMQSCKVSELQRLLREIKPERLKRMNRSDMNNPRRLIRTIEIAKQLKTQNANLKIETQNLKFDKLVIGLTASYKILYERIDKRVDERVKMGVRKEVEELIKKGYQWDLPSMTAMGYRQWKDFFEGKESEEGVIKRWKFAEHGYARRQMTYFRKMPEIVWFNITNLNWQDEVEKKVKDWYS